MQVNNISFLGSDKNVNTPLKHSEKTMANLMDNALDSFESISRTKPRSGLQKFMAKAMMSLGVVGLGLGAQACDPINEPVDPVIPTKTELSETQKGFMDVMSYVTAAKYEDGKMLDSAFVKESDYNGNIVGYDGYKVDNKASTKDTIAYKKYAYNNKSELIDKYDVKAYKNSKGNIETKSYDDLKYFMGIEGYKKDGISIIESFDNIDRYKLTPNDSIVDKTAISNGVKKYLKNIFHSVK